MNIITRIVASLAISCLLVTSAYAFIIETVSQWNGSDGIIYLGNPSSATATYGQTFKVPETAVLESWTFWLSNRSNSPQPDVQLDGYLAEWAGDRAVVPPLYQDTGRVVPPSYSGEFHALTFTMPDIVLDPNKTYVMFLNTSPYSGTPWPPWVDELATLGSTGDTYADGAFWYQDSDGLFSNVFNFPWACGDEGNGCRYGDAAFQAIFASIPEPSAALLLSLGVIVVLVFHSLGTQVEPA